MGSQVAIDEGLFTWPSDTPQLIGSRCTSCGTVTFPAQGGCPKCFSDVTEETLLPRRGTIWTCTTQGFRPKSAPEGPYTGPQEFETFALGYVELPGHCKVESRLVGLPPEEFKIGMEVELVIVPWRKDEEGNDVMTFAFQPVEAS